MVKSEFQLEDGTWLGNNRPLVLIAGPCVIESLDMCVEVAGHLRAVTERLGISYIFKSSFDKANRSSIDSFRGPGITDGLNVLSEIKRQAGVKVLTDFHTAEQAAEVAKVADVLQVPAFLCRQTDLLLAAAATGSVISVKKGQFMAPWDMLNVCQKLEQGGCDRVIVTERGSSFGYNNLVVDFRSLLYFREQGIPVCFDATHSVQLPSGQGTVSGGQRQYVAGLSRAAVSLGISSLFWEVHPDPDQARCDGPNQLHLADTERLLKQMVELSGWAQAAN